MKRAQILGVGSILPSQVVTTESLLAEAKTELYGIPTNYIAQELGILEVRHAEPHLSISNIAAIAGEKALVNAETHPDSIDAVIYCGCESEYIEPSTAHLIGHQLGINASLCFDISNACHGFTSGLITANALLLSGQCTNILLVTAEVCSRHVQDFIEIFKNQEVKGDARKVLGAFTLGDAGGAMIIGLNESQEQERGILGSLNKTQSQHNQLCHYKSPIDAGMEMGKIVAKSLGMIRNLMPETYQFLNWLPTDVDACIPHQVGGRVFDRTLDIAGLDHTKSIKTYEHFGNLASATIAVNYDLMKENGMIKPFSKVLLISSGSGISITQAGIIA